MAKSPPRSQPFSAHEWSLFERWLNYVEKGLEVSYEVSQNGEEMDTELPTGVSTRVTGVRWYATDLALLSTLIYRAAGRLGGESVCFDQELSDLFDEIDAEHPDLRELRNALFAHPPFVDGLISDDEVLFFSTMGVMVAPAEGGAAKSIIDPFLSHMSVPDWIRRFREILARRRADADQNE